MRKEHAFLDGTRRLAFSRTNESCKNRTHLLVKFVAHPNVQQQMSTLWYDGLPGFRRKSIFGQCLQIVKIGVAFPFYSAMYIFFPRSRIGRVMKKPFVKFISNAFSYLLFLRE
ncbi:hypothetical protein HPB51_013045 [Rhipicephalus microplus]|uniref:Uncharacterized protein n=1 Tax=Rhipicephalus microplus TaxID=6941 RepID=A0A9J6F2K3_RHIMP|nr:hypothetical protein HPB51_013045 [Rhipicephalus microplus]